MSTELVLVHGRSQQDKDPDELKATWVTALRAGLERRGLALPVDESAIRFPYYGDALRDMAGPARDHPGAADVVVRGPGEDLDPQRTRFLTEALREVAVAVGATPEELAGRGAGDPVERGPTRHLRTLLMVLDRRAPGLGAAMIARLMADVHSYLHVRPVAARIDDGVRAAFAPDGAARVVVAHSLGSVVAYCLLRDPLLSAQRLVTLGSPLGISAIRAALRPLAHPPGVGSWVNGRDVHDVVALHPLDEARFGVQPAIEDLATVRNRTPNRHGIEGYLSDPDLAERIHQALVRGR